MHEIMQLISVYGFPMVTAMYLLIRIEPVIRGLKASVDTLIMLVALEQGMDAESIAELRNEVLIKMMAKRSE